MSDFPTVDRVIADLKRLSAGFWNTDREREIGNVMVDARHCLEQLLADHKGLREQLKQAASEIERLRAERNQWMHNAMAHEQIAAELRVRLMESPTD